MKSPVFVFLGLLLTPIAHADCLNVFDCISHFDQDGLEKVLEGGANPNVFNNMGNTPLGITSFYGRTEMMGMLIRFGANVNLKSQRGTPPLVDAADDYGRLEAVQLLVRAGAEINATDQRLNTALMKAAWRGHLRVVQFLIQQRANVSLKNDSNNTALQYALNQKRQEVALALTQAGSPVNEKNDQTEFPLLVAAAHGYHDVVVALLDRGATIDMQTGFGTTALRAAAGENHNEVVRTLLGRGASPHLANDAGYGPLHVSAYLGNLENIEALVRAGARLEQVNRSEETPLYIAAYRGHRTSVELLARLGANVNAPERDRRTPLMIAVMRNDIETTRALIQLRADMNLQDNIGSTAIFYTLIHRNEAMLDLLIQSGAEVNRENSQGTTPLTQALSFNSEMLVRKLLQSGAHANYKNRFHLTPLCYVIRNDRIPLMQLLVDHGADINLDCGTQKNTPLMLAVNLSPGTEALDFILARLPQLNSRNFDEDTALLIATRNQSIEATQKLIQAGADVNLANRRGQTPIMIAADQDNTTLIYAFRDARADLNRQDEYGQSLTHIFIMRGPGSYIHIHNLLNNGLNVNLRDHNGQTPLFYAIYRDQLNAAEILLLSNADPNIGENHGYTPLTFVIDRKKRPLFEKLIEHRANPNLRDSRGYAPLYYATQVQSEQGEDYVTPLFRAGATLSVKTRWQDARLDRTVTWKVIGKTKEVTVARPSPWNHYYLEIETVPALYRPAGQVIIQNQTQGGTLYRSNHVFHQSNEGRAVIYFPQSTLLEQTGAVINRNLFEATVNLQLGGLEFTTLSENYLMLFQRKIVLFLPGVFGSELWLQGNENLQVFPDGGFHAEFSDAACDANGVPLREAAKLDLFRRVNFGVPAEGRIESLLVYHNIENRREVAHPFDYPQLYAYRGETPPANPETALVPYHVVQAWPYDWRKNLEGTVDLLVNGSPQRSPTDPVVPPYRLPPSIRQVLGHAMRDDIAGRYVAPKVILASHSTGGLITRGALRRPGIENLVEKAFYVDVPFFGAPKAYYVFLTGDMLFPLVGYSEMQQLSPNVPIVYYLSPTAQYPGIVSINPTYRRSTAPSAATFMNQLVRQSQQVGAYPANLGWNQKLEADAHRFHESIQGAPRIGYDNVTVFWSNSQLNDTQGPVYVGPNGGLYQSIPGDSTVPVESQRGDYPSDRLVELTSYPQHVPSPNDDQVWRTIKQRIE